MKTTIRAVALSEDKKVILKEVNLEDIKVPVKATLNIDGSTDNTGIAIVRESDGALYYSCSFKREKQETPVQYKIRLKEAVKKILLNNRVIERVYYEEPFMGYVTSIANLMMLRTFVEELVIENEDTLGHVKHKEINNMKWKKEFLNPDKVPQGTELQKEAVRRRMLNYLPFLEPITQDEIDAYAMGFVATVKIKNGEEYQLESKKKAKPFKYEVLFAGGDSDDDIMGYLMEIYNGPKEILANGITLEEIKSRVNFEKAIYENMGSDDRLLIIKFSSNTHGNVILEHRIGNLAATYKYIYALVWRKNRKR